MTVSMRVMSVGDGYRYLLSTVAVGDGDRSLSTPLTRYYAAQGTPPGRWLGSGVAGLGSGQIAVGDQVSETPASAPRGEWVGTRSAARHWVVRIRSTSRYWGASRSGSRNLTLRSGQSRGVRRSPRDRAEEAERGTRRAVAGYDFTFSIPKSASVLWAVADGTQALIADAHHAAIAEVVALMEREVAATRTGATGRNGAVGRRDRADRHRIRPLRQPPATHLRTHVVISNKARTVLDGKWRSLDGRPMHAATVALSELHEAIFADRTSLDGSGWNGARDMGRDRNPAWASPGCRRWPSSLFAHGTSTPRPIASSSSTSPSMGGDQRPLRS